MSTSTPYGLLRADETIDIRNNSFNVQADLFTVSDPTDATKKVALLVSGVPTGTTVTLTIPAASGTLPTTANPVFTGSLTVTSTTGAFTPPKMTTTQRDAIATPAKGNIIYNTSTDQMNYYDGAWQVFAKV